MPAIKDKVFLCHKLGPLNINYINIAKNFIPLQVGNGLKFWEVWEEEVSSNLLQV